MSDTDSAGIDEQRGLWNEWLGRRQLGVAPHDRARGLRTIEAISQLKLQHPAILEIGCANGWLTRELAHLGPTVGVDLSDAAITAATGENPDGEYLAGDFLTMDLGSRRFDVIVCLQTMMYFDQEAFVRRVVELLNPGGYLIVSVPNWPMWEQTGWERQTSSRISANLFGLAGVKSVLSPRFSIIEGTTMLTDGMGGHRGIYRILNSDKLNKLAKAALGANRLEALRGRLGLGETVIAVARLR